MIAALSTEMMAIATDTQMAAVTIMEQMVVKAIFIRMAVDTTTEQMVVMDTNISMVADTTTIPMVEAILIRIPTPRGNLPKTNVTTGCFEPSFRRACPLRLNAIL